jgi:hypothetical protein
VCSDAGIFPFLYPLCCVVTPVPAFSPRVPGFPCGGLDPCTGEDGSEDDGTPDDAVAVSDGTRKTK